MLLGVGSQELKFLNRFRSVPTFVTARPVNHQPQVEYSGINVTGGGGGPTYFLGLKFSTAAFFWVEDLTVYFLGLKNLRVFFWV